MIANDDSPHPILQLLHMLNKYSHAHASLGASAPSHLAIGTERPEHRFVAKHLPVFVLMVPEKDKKGCIIFHEPEHRFFHVILQSSSGLSSLVYP